MRDERLGGWALIVGSAMGLVTMAFHPTGAEMLRDFDGRATTNIAAHALAMLAVPVAMFGAMALARRLDPGAGLARLALTFYGFGQVAVLLAAIASGLVATAMVSDILAGVGAEAESARQLLRYTSTLNHAFATVFVAASSIAIAFWSLVMLGARDFPRWVAWLGLAVGVALVAITLLGRLRLDVHHFGLVVLAQSVWLVASGVCLVRAREGGGPAGAEDQRERP